MERSFTSRGHFHHALQRLGIEWFRTKERIQLLCHHCHAIKSASEHSSDGTWGELHWQAVQIVANMNNQEG